MLFNTKNKKWFTLVEVLFVCSIFAIMVVWIILAINRSYSFMNNVRLQVRATNFAREWVEMMFNFRDTNRRKYSWKKDELRLCRDVVDSNCPAGNYISSWLYYIQEASTGTDHYITLREVGRNPEFYSDDWFWDDGIDDSFREDAKIVFTWTYSFLSWSYQDNWEWTWEQMTGNIEELLWSETEFYRLVRVYGIYDKNVTSTSSSTLVTNLNKSTPKEMRFCVKVFYRNLSMPHSTELCSIMTNFEK